MSIEIVIVFLAGFAAGGVLLWILARLVDQKECLRRTDELRQALGARISEAEGRARYAEGQIGRASCRERVSLNV